MKRSILIFGALSGFIIISVNTLSMILGYGHVWLGYLVMLIVFSIIVVAVKQYRDQQPQGVISFRPALLLGLGITLMASAVYVLMWELYLLITNYQFIDAYFDSVIEQHHLAGYSQTELATALMETERMKAQYHNPLIRMPMSLLEIFPVGLLVSVFTAAVLSNHKSTTKSGA